MMAESGYQFPVVKFSFKSKISTIKVLVIFLFLGSPRATLVPAVTIPVALIGSFIGIYAFGYSINILTLFADDNSRACRMDRHND